MPAEPSEVLGQRYRLLGKLGEGAMGSVYRARDRLSGQLVALKRVRLDATQVKPARTAPAGASTQEPLTPLRLSLAREFGTLASLRHPNIISVLDYGFDGDGQPFFTMELLPAPQTIVEAASGQPLALQVEYLVQLLRALAYLHRRGIIHCDLKPRTGASVWTRPNPSAPPRRRARTRVATVLR